MRIIDLVWGGTMSSPVTRKAEVSIVSSANGKATARFRFIYWTTRGPNFKTTLEIKAGTKTRLINMAPYETDVKYEAAVLLVDGLPYSNNELTLPSPLYMATGVAKYIYDGAPTIDMSINDTSISTTDSGEWTMGDTIVEVTESGKGIGFGASPKEETFSIGHDKIEWKGKSLIDYFYPVGALYWSMDATNPQTWMGGKWEQIKDRFILAAGDAYAANAEGGEATHALTKKELPNISGTIYNIASQSSGYGIGADGDFKTVSSGSTSGYAQAWHKPDKQDNVKIDVGNNAAHNNMPPYKVAYCWQRVE